MQSANPPPQSTDNQPQTSIIANPANPQTHHHSTSKLESHRAALNHELFINCLVGSGSGAASIAERSDPSSSPTVPPSTTSPTAPPSTTSSPTHHQQPKTGTPTSNPSPDLVKKKKTKTQISPTHHQQPKPGAGGAVMRDRQGGGMELCKKERGSRKGGGAG